MKTSVIGRAALVALATLTVTVDRAVAQSADAQRIEDLEKEKAAMQARIRDLESENQKANLRIGQLQSRHITPHEARTQPASSGELSTRQRPAPADMSVKASPAVLQPLFSWTGFYVGGNVGYGVGSDWTSGAESMPGVVNAGSAVVAPAGVIGGAQLGYNWQGGQNWLVGLEADFQASGQRGTSCIIACVNAPSPAEVFVVQHAIDYFGTIRGRAGFVNGNTLFYVTGGGAYGRVEQSNAFTMVTGVSAASGTGSTREDRFGYVIGGGIEAALGANWTGKIEYLHMDLGSTGNTLTAPNVPLTFATTASIRDNIVRAGLNYQFGGGPQPLSAYASNAALPIATVYSWTGLYVGANAGYGLGNDRIAQSAVVLGQVDTSEPNSAITPKGALGGVQLGYNWQVRPNWLVGIEADLQTSSQNQTSCGPLECFQQTLAGNPPTTALFTVQHQLDYFGTVRGRLGAVANDVLYYVTGGAAFAHVRQTVDVNSSANMVFVTGTTAADMFGWVAGAGIEAPLWGGWTGKAEYLYMDLGNTSMTINISAPGVPATLTTNGSIRDHIMRVGTNYHF